MECGLIVADAYGGEVIRPAQMTALNGNRRRSLVLRMARAAAERLQRLRDGAI